MLSVRGIEIEKPQPMKQDLATRVTDDFQIF
jgi:hypothetical protein